jgi:molybdopterin/thiamine biosynthesis adenylyltransferase/rhodanese-related sulfurtransferase
MSMMNVQSYLEKLRSRVPESDPQSVYASVFSGKGVLIDIRESGEVEDGSPIPALKITKGMLEMRAPEMLSEESGPYYLLCASGRRSLVAAGNLMDMGYEKVYSVSGGFSRWKAEGLPWGVPPVLSAADKRRYQRHLLIPEVGEEGQLKLLASRVLLVGAGGLGSPIGFYLAAAGVGTLGIIDDDRVDRSNLQRQILHTDSDVGSSKVSSAAKRLRALNPDIRVVEHSFRLTEENIESLLVEYDVVIDGTDNFHTRYLVNDACVKLGKANVHGSVYQFEGNVSVFWPEGSSENPCYRCLFPEPTPADLAPSCAEAGVLGVLPGVVGTLCATEALKWILGAGELMAGRLLRIDLLNNDFEVVTVPKNPDCPYCGDRQGKPFPEYSVYAESCQS